MARHTRFLDRRSEQGTYVSSSSKLIYKGDMVLIKILFFCFILEPDTLIKKIHMEKQTGRVMVKRRAKRGSWPYHLVTVKLNNLISVILVHK